MQMLNPVSNPCGQYSQLGTMQNPSPLKTLLTKKRPTLTKKRPTVTKAVKPPSMKYECLPWNSQTIRASYRGVDTNSFTLSPYLSKLTANEIPTDKLASATPQYKERESQLWTNIADTLKRVKTVRDFGGADAWWVAVPGSKAKVQGYIEKAEAALNEIVNTYSEWRQVPYRVHLWVEKGYVSLVGTEKDIEYAGVWDVSWPLNERFTDREWIQQQAQRGDIAGAKIEGHGDSDFAWVWDLYNSKLSKDPVLNHQIWYVEQARHPIQGGKIYDFDDLYAVMGRPSWTSRRNAIKSIRVELKKAAENARCAEVWTGFVVSYAQNRQLWEKQQAGAGTTLNPGDYADATMQNPWTTGGYYPNPPLSSGGGSNVLRKCLQGEQTAGMSKTRRRKLRARLRNPSHRRNPYGSHPPEAPFGPYSWSWPWYGYWSGGQRQ